MIRHLFKLIWNKKKQNFLLIVEMLVSFMVMFAVFTLLVYYYTNYKRPMGFVYENVWTVSYSNNRLDTKNEDTLAMYYESLKRTVEALPEVRAVSYVGSNSPFSANNSNNSTTVNNVQIMANTYQMDDDYARLVQLHMLSGRWFSKLDDGAKDKPIVINATLKEKAYGNKNAIGQRFEIEGKQVVIIGVVQDLKDKGDYVAPQYSHYKRVERNSYASTGRMLVAIRPEAGAAFESKLNKVLTGIMPTANVEIEHLTKKRIAKNSITLVPMIILLIVAGFLIVNVALGLFGVLWYNISRRKAEIGLRRAIGASGNNIVLQIVSETLVLASLSLLLGSFFAIQFPLLNIFDLPAGVYLTALVLSILFIYGLVIICAIYPGKQASNILPAVALHED
ncbi:FtsX-like permease family protein [Chitinophaga sp. SYP-B3965]|uniref:ABC transporter permease n=1 Tax=Chitinophaga sp. SYP-B3965 TaxID=2663120 RepID=UPI001299740B|nr:ABC transporter permease [Chitinophaga sp. SYP-B3965]MRG44158.1 FtsX-like permease family protein [Chitinophaga sp. SYP-B3965]